MFSLYQPRALFVRNLPFKITAEEMYDIFGKYGPIRQIRLGITCLCYFLFARDYFLTKHAVYPS